MEIKQGFSIIELVVVIGLISLLALAMSAILLTTIVSSNRVRNATAVKQAGDYAITQIQSIVRNSRSITSCDPDTTTIVLENQDGNITTITLGINQIASNSASLIPTDLAVSSPSITCVSSSGDVRLATFSFDLSRNNPNLPTRENPVTHFSAGAEIRN